MLDEQTENQHIQGLTLCLVSLSHPYIPSGGVVDMDGASYNEDTYMNRRNDVNVNEEGGEEKV